MLFKLVAQIFAVASVVTFVAALPSPDNGPVGVACANSGHPGTEQCCHAVGELESLRVHGPLWSLGLASIARETISNFPASNGQVGIACSPITVGNSTCNRQTVCCSGNEYRNGEVILGCRPIDR